MTDTEQIIEAYELGRARGEAAARHRQQQDAAAFADDCVRTERGLCGAEIARLTEERDEARAERDAAIADDARAEQAELVATLRQERDAAIAALGLTRVALDHERAERDGARTACEAARNERNDVIKARNEACANDPLANAVRALIASVFSDDSPPKTPDHLVDCVGSLDAVVKRWRMEATRNAPFVEAYHEIRMALVIGEGELADGENVTPADVVAIVRKHEARHAAVVVAP